MNDLLKQRIIRLLDAASDERGYQILDFVEFLDSKYAERSEPDGLLSRITATVENTMRAGKLPIQAITGTMGLMDTAAKVMKGLAAAGQGMPAKQLYYWAHRVIAVHLIRAARAHNPPSLEVPVKEHAARPSQGRPIPANVAARVSPDR